jgi:hypothetical protein
MKSIIQENYDECFVCSLELIETPERNDRAFYVLEEHHCIHGTANRKLSEKYGLKVKLCMEHHRGNTGVHNNIVLDNLIKEMAQRKFEEYYKGTYSRSDFIRIFGKSYL